MQTPLTDPRSIRAAANHEANVERISEGRIRVIPGQVWLGSGTHANKHATPAEQKLTYGCNVNPEHPDWEARPYSILQGKGCFACMAAAIKARQDAITASFVGQTTADGHVILEHSGYHQAPSDKKRGRIGNAKYRYRCGNCGEIGEAWGCVLKRPGRVIRCPHCRDAWGKLGERQKLISDSTYAEALNQFYLASVNYDTFIKVGICKAGGFRDRTEGDYTHQGEEQSYLYPIRLSKRLPRAWCWAAEQIILKETEALRAPLPAHWGKWDGYTELRTVLLDVDAVYKRFCDLIEEIRAKGWEQVLDEHIKAPSSIPPVKVEMDWIQPQIWRYTIQTQLMIEKLIAKGGPTPLPAD